ncbi:MAG TPA: YggT family protein [Acidimicrobiales bacterium]|jgi:YggT family protein|nr:YggT family protein [Acidimicrobiales bacterium]
MFAVIVVLLELFLLVLFAYCILSLVIAYARISYDSPVIKVQRVLTSIVEPVLRPIRRIIPVARVGGVGLDLSALILFLVIQVILIPVFAR